MQVSGKPLFGMVSACCSTRHFFGWDSVQERCPTSTCNVGSCVSVRTTWCDSTTPCGPRHRGTFALFGEGMLPASASQRFWRFLSSCRAMSFWTWWAHISTRSTSFRKHSPSTTLGFPWKFTLNPHGEPPWGRWSNRLDLVVFRASPAQDLPKGLDLACRKWLRPSPDHLRKILLVYTICSICVQVYRYT